MQFVEFPALYKKGSTGALLIWNISVRDNVIETSHGQVDGSMQNATDVIKEGKSAGKKNATTAEQQALAEAKSKWTKKQSLGYVLTPESALAGEVNKDIVLGGIYPMLSPNQSYPKNPDLLPDYLKFPCMEQPKLDGICCIAEISQGKATLWSRKRKQILSMPHIIEALEDLAREKKLGYTLLHGELYHHSYKDRFQELVSIVRSGKPDTTGVGKLFQLHVYDLPKCETLDIDYDSPYIKRYEAYHSVLGPRFGDDPIQAVLGNICDNMQQLVDCYEARLLVGYEGSMAKNLDGQYGPDKRSHDILKMKKFEEGEAEIVKVLDGRGKDAGTCSTIRLKFVGNSGEVVFVEPTVACSYEQKKEYWDNREKLVGKMATITYKRLTDDGVPYIPSIVWKAVRDYE